MKFDGHDKIEIQNPLEWPPARKRTSAGQRQNARFTATRYVALTHLRTELARLKIDRARVTLDLAIRRSDDLPLANAREPSDTGVAVYYTRRGRDHVLACDAYRVVAANVMAVAKTIEAQRGIVRWGCLSIDEAIAGSRLALPGDVSGARPWREVLGVVGVWTHRAPKDALLAYAKSQHRMLISNAHPDKKGGDTAIAAELNAAMDEATRELSTDDDS